MYLYRYFLNSGAMPIVQPLQEHANIAVAAGHVYFFLHQSEKQEGPPFSKKRGTQNTHKKRKTNARVLSQILAHRKSKIEITRKNRRKR